MTASDVQRTTVDACAAIREARKQLEDLAWEMKVQALDDPHMAVKLHYARKLLAASEADAHEASGHVDAITRIAAQNT